MEMARIAHRLNRRQPRRTTTVSARATPTPLMLALGALMLAVVGCGKSLCPAGMHVDSKRSKAGVNAFCDSTTDKDRGAFVDLYPGGGRRQVCLFDLHLGPGPGSGGRGAARPGGAYQAFHPDGARWLEGRYENGVKVGRWTQWAPDGRKVAEGQYRDGLMIEGAPVGFPATCEAIVW
jgi:hypothetical protein